MTTRKLEEIASHLDDMSVTLEEIREEIKGKDGGHSLPKLDQVQADMERAADVIEDVVDPDGSESPVRLGNTTDSGVNRPGPA